MSPASAWMLCWASSNVVAGWLSLPGASILLSSQLLLLLSHEAGVLQSMISWFAGAQGVASSAGKGVSKCDG